ncbi:hypothetical protein CX649_04090 [Bacillaceae bacterium ZC4]|nr:hypothetical protein CX649_04090 [Bacillaceae bacterium ZC4]
MSIKRVLWIINPSKLQQNQSRFQFITDSGFNLISDPGNWWFQYPLFGWGIGLLVHGASTFAFGIFGEEWEEKKIKKYMEKDR